MLPLGSVYVSERVNIMDIQPLFNVSGDSDSLAISLSKAVRDSSMAAKPEYFDFSLRHKPLPTQYEHHLTRDGPFDSPAP